MTGTGELARVLSIVRIVADDLTGALDAAAPLVGLAGPMPVIWDAAAAARQRGSLALDSESRTAPAPGRWLQAFEGAELAFKKIDSLLRGRTVDEIAACLASGLFASAVIAPAFPAQQRVTRGGRQYWRPGPATALQPVEVELMAELRRCDLPVRHTASSSDLVGSGFFLCDAITEDDLTAIVRAGQALAGPSLWIGTAGLARAIAGPAASAVPGVLPAPLLLVIGSHHPVTLAQLEMLDADAADAVVRIGDGQIDLERPAAALESALAAQGRAALVFALPDGTGAEVAGPLFDRAMAAAVERIAPPRALVVSGGATLFRLVRVLGATSLLVQGELIPGIALSRLEGGRWPGAVVVSKSGAFGPPDLLVSWWRGCRPRRAR